MLNLLSWLYNYSYHSTFLEFALWSRLDLGWTLLLWICCSCCCCSYYYCSFSFCSSRGYFIGGSPSWELNITNGWLKYLLAVEPNSQKRSAISSGRNGESSSMNCTGDNREVWQNMNGKSRPELFYWVTGFQSYSS